VLNYIFFVVVFVHLGLSCKVTGIFVFKRMVKLADIYYNLFVEFDLFFLSSTEM